MRWARAGWVAGGMAAMLAAAGCTPSNDPTPNALHRLNEAAQRHQGAPFAFTAHLTYYPYYSDSPTVATARWWAVPDSADSLLGVRFYVEITDADQHPEVTMWYWADSAWIVWHNDSVVRALLPDQASRYFRMVGARDFRPLWQGLDTQQVAEDGFQWEVTDSVIALFSPGEGGKEDIRNIRDSLWVDADGVLRRRSSGREWLFMTTKTQWEVVDFTFPAAEAESRLAPRMPSDYAYKPLPPETENPSEAEDEDESDWMAPLLAMQGKAAPDFGMRLLGGDSARLSDYKGRAVLLDFWYVGCYWCSKAVPALKRLYQDYHTKGLEIIGVNPYDDPEAIEKYHRYWELPYAVAQVDRNVPKQFQVIGYPTMVLIDPAGRIFRIRFGYIDSLYDKLAPQVDTLIGMIP